MHEQQFNLIRNFSLIAVVLFQLCHLSWEYLNGGIATHHLFMRSDLPGISNLWGLVILPALVWFAATRIKKRFTNYADQPIKLRRQSRNLVLGFCGLLIVGILQSFAFTYGYQSPMMYLLIGILITAVFLPLYRVECILGYVIGLTFVFGPVIPFVGVLMFTTVSFVSLKCIKPLIKHLLKSKQVTT